MTDRAGAARRDWGVILARGGSRRMGKPKGACRTASDERPLLVRVTGLYASGGFGVAVVTTAALRRIYRPLLRDARIRWIIGGGGRGTAASAGAALQALASEASHLWLHPVDLPAVTARTLAVLRARSRREPHAVIVPHFRGRRGHPVILPVARLSRCADPRLPGRMRDQLRRWCGDRPGTLAPLRRVACADPGIVRDVDDPGALTTAV
jgi:CTP:molybdopterin cytidylyltransferase MocA